MWYPNVIYVEEPIYEKFVQSLGFVIKNYSSSNEWREASSEIDAIFNKFVKNKKSDGVEVTNNHHYVVFQHRLQ